MIWLPSIHLAKSALSLTDNTYDEGRFGLFIGSVNTNDLEIFVEEIAYWDLSD